MRWSTRFIIPGIFIIAVGIVPLALGHFNIVALEFAASVITVGLLILLIGLGLRRITKAFEKTSMLPAVAPRGPHRMERTPDSDAPR
jgi:FtsH-binding integral membrane protein